MLSSSENTRSHDAEFGASANTMRAADAHAGMRDAFARHQVSTCSLKAAMSELAITTPAAAAT